MASSFLDYLLSENTSLPEQLLAQANALQLGDVIERVKALQKRTKLTMYTHGHLSTLETADLYRDITSNIFTPDMTLNLSDIQSLPQLAASLQANSLTSDWEWKSRARRLTEPHTRIVLPALNPADPNSALITYFQVSLRYSLVL